MAATSGFVDGLDFETAMLTANESITFSWSADSVTFQTVQAVPEPSASFLLFASCLLITLRRNRNRRVVLS
ncbi:hypothetical protein RBSH_02945 [Rhodopirellula baltica SH28]|uniref:PEP-CTERM protein-sorting domain-containing protein n=1 Tax=Rhodopirellula baltica SH28 TaxID=993517 RepID=K5E7J4_RHOBT|nr:hypothetical protein RBSH_02945 [Rhodopirellula baltica SH28]